jgi:hypothetical protein
MFSFSFFSSFEKSFDYVEVKRCEGICSTYSDLDLIGRGPSARLLCGLGGLEPEKKGWAKRANALAARCEYLVGGGGGGGIGERDPERSDMVLTPLRAHDQLTEW